VGASLAAISKGSAVGWVQVRAVMACYVTSLDQSPGTAAAKGDFVFMVLALLGPGSARYLRAQACSHARGRPPAGCRSAPIDLLRDLAGPVPGHRGCHERLRLQGADPPRNRLSEWFAGASLAATSKWSAASWVQVRAVMACYVTSRFAERPGRHLQGAGREARRGDRERPPDRGGDHRIAGKLPGYLSLSARRKFADVPNVLAALSKVPAAKLAAEILSGRLDMVAIFGSLATLLGYVSLSVGLRSRCAERPGLSSPQRS
jgi:hypothetical protein